MAERMLKFVTTPRATPAKREAAARTGDFHEIYAEFIDAKAAEQASGGDGAVPAGPVDSAEKALIARLLEFPAEVHEAAGKRAPHRICAYASDVAASFHAFYRDCQVIGAEGAGVEAARLELCGVTAETIRRALGLLGISAPDRM